MPSRGSGRRERHAPPSARRNTGNPEAPALPGEVGRSCQQQPSDQGRPLGRQGARVLWSGSGQGLGAFDFPGGRQRAEFSRSGWNLTPRCPRPRGVLRRPCSSPGHFPVLRISPRALGRRDGIANQRGLFLGESPRCSQPVSELVGTSRARRRGSEDGHPQQVVPCTTGLLAEAGREASLVLFPAPLRLLGPLLRRRGGRKALANPQHAHCPALRRVPERRTKRLPSTSRGLLVIYGVACLRQAQAVAIHCRAPEAPPPVVLDSGRWRRLPASNGLRWGTS